MTAGLFELEAKFFLVDRAAVIARLQAVQALLVKPRVYERNLRFDTRSGDLEARKEVLRLRVDDAVRLTYKGAGSLDDGVSRRQEIEFTVGDEGAAQAMLEALGFEVSFLYEKYRTTYQLGPVEIVVDETPLGDLLEIEGPATAQIQEAASLLNLRWETRINASYHELFLTACRSLSTTFPAMTFEAIPAGQVTAAALGVQPADLQG
jgi:adenylate cyclase class 2